MPDASRVEYSARRDSATIFVFRTGLRCGNRAGDGGAHEDLNQNLTVAGALVLALTFAIVAATPEQEKAFTEKYKAAMKGKDTATLESFLYTQGSDPTALSFTK